MSVRAFTSPSSLADALAALAADPDARPVAGGTDLVVASRQGRRPLPASLVAIDRISELDGQRVDAGGLTLGALTSHAWLASSPDVRSDWTALADASAIVGSPATRGTGTLGGNLVNASPAAETTAPLVVFGATVTLASSGGRREVAVAELATGPGRTLMAPGELLVSVAVPRPTAGSGSAYVRLEYRQAMEIAVVGAAVLVSVDGGRIADARIALTAVAPTIVRVEAAEAALVGASVDAVDGAALGELVAEAARPIGDVRASQEYRSAMVAVVARRALAAALIRASGAGGAVPVPASRWAHGQEV
jgi:CO/xanthine dehydrogenase FAD-binding subunit